MMAVFNTKSVTILAILLIIPAILTLWGEEASSLSQETQTGERPGFTDTPYLPGQEWRVHDATRPYPPVVTPGTASTQEQPGQPPSDAVVLFDGSDLSQWNGQGVGDQAGKIVEPAWKVENGYMEVVPGTGSIFSKEQFGDCQIHVEWATPVQAPGEGQGRGNSGIMIMGRYEIQVLDSYENLTYADGQASALYGQYPPLVNASRKPGEWQTYDIIFEAPRFDGDRLVEPAYATVLHNGVVTHHRQAFIGQVAHKQVAKYEPHPPRGPLMLQNHRDPVRFRNVWVRPLGEYDGGETER
ncbi:MAG TPA: DUF1080 domain-containing protein [Acidobacteriota bacterium]|nr:DUF1080 domain-containing protein [Acidobacteriota bacterium]